MANTSFDKYLEEKIKSKPTLKQELEKADRAVEIAYQIYTLRKKKGLTQSQLAKRIGVSQSNIARIENADYTHYTRETLYKVAKGLEDADLNIFINQLEQTNKLIGAYDSLPTYQNFIFAGISGKYFLSGRAPFNRDETITQRVVIKNEIIKVSSENKESKGEANRLYYQTL